MNTAAILFALAAAGGATMFVMCLRGAQRPPTWLALGHGVIAAAGLITLGWEFVQTSLPDLARWSFFVLIAAALGGAALFLGFHIRGRPLPILLVLGHGLTALAGLGLLIAAIYQ